MRELVVVDHKHLLAVDAKTWPSNRTGSELLQTAQLFRLLIGDLGRLQADIVPQLSFSTFHR